jgi:hypothetical protein
MSPTIMACGMSDHLYDDFETIVTLPLRQALAAAMGAINSIARTTPLRS